MNQKMRAILIAVLTLLLCLAAACSNGDAAASAPEPTKEAAQAAAQAQAASVPTAAPTEAPTPEPTAEPTEAPTPEPTAEPEYVKYAQIRDELKEKYATTREAYEQVQRAYGLSPSTDRKGIFMADWDAPEYKYNYRLQSLVKELLTEAYYASESDSVQFMKQALYDPEDAVVEAPGVLRVEHNIWLDVLKEYDDFAPMYFISLESEDPASGCWMCLYRDLPENVLHVAALGEEDFAALEEAALLAKLAENGVVLSEGELIVDDVDLNALRNQLAKTYQTDSALWSELFSKLDAVKANPFDKTSNCAVFVNWDNPNARLTGWYCDAANKVWNDLSKKSKNNGGHPTADMLKDLAYDPDNVEILGPSILRSTSNKWLKSGESMIWISLQSTDPHTGIWVGFYGPIPPAAQE